MDLASEVHTHGRGIPRVIRTVEQAIDLIDRKLGRELASKPRWTFARALLVEATRTGKSRDMNTAVRQLKEALRVEHWLVDNETKKPSRQTP
jgi:hypothetical protein